MTRTNETSTSMQLTQAAAALDVQQHQIRQLLDAAEDPVEAERLNEALDNIRHAKLRLEKAGDALNAAAEMPCSNL